MNSDFQVRLIHAVGQCLRPLARVLLRSGISFRQFSDLAKVAFVQEALSERKGRARRTNLSRVAIRTGISRKEVARIRSRLEDSHVDAVSVDSQSTHAARVLQMWHTDPRFVDAKGVPVELPFISDGLHFGAVVKAAGGDVPPGAVRAELEDAGAVVETAEGLLRPMKRYFVPANVGEDLLVGFTHILQPVLEGIAHNTRIDCSDPFVQRVAYSDRLSPLTAVAFREFGQVRASNFVQSVDDWLSANEMSEEHGLPAQSRIGLGVFYFEVTHEPAGTAGRNFDDRETT